MTGVDGLVDKVEGARREYLALLEGLSEPLNPPAQTVTGQMVDLHGGGGGSRGFRSEP